MSFKDFSELNVSTMVLIARYEGCIELEPIFVLLPVTYIELPPRKRKTKKIKIPHCKIPGSILSLRFAGFTRGIFRTVSKTHFRNSITLDISVKEKNLSIKLSKSSVHIAGAKSVDMAKEAFDYLFGHIQEIQNYIEQIQSDLEESKKCVNWILEHCKGEYCEQVEKDLHKHENTNINMIIHNSFDDHKIRRLAEED
jgi:hypothetical protein